MRADEKQREVGGRSGCERSGCEQCEGCEFVMLYFFVSMTGVSRGTADVRIVGLCVFSGIVFFSVMISFFVARDNDGGGDVSVLSGSMLVSTSGFHVFDNESFHIWSFPRDSVMITAKRGQESMSLVGGSRQWVSLMIPFGSKEKREQAILVDDGLRQSFGVLDYESDDGFSAIFFLTALGQRGIMGYEAFYFLHGGLTDILFALQAGPLLIRDGRIHQSFSPTSQNRDYRAGLCLDNEGFVHLFAAKRPVSFFVLAHDMLKRGCDDALALVSRHAGWRDSVGLDSQSGQAGGSLILYHW